MRTIDTDVFAAEQPPMFDQTDREHKSFDPLASVHLFRHDLRRYGHVLPETRSRVYDEELTFIAEGINRPLHTEFNLRSVEGDLLYFDRGEWRPYLGTLMRGLETAAAEARIDPRKRFQADRAAMDIDMGYRMRSLQPGERISWYSAYPQAEEDHYGAAFVAGLGYQPKRKMGFLYQAVRQTDGSVTLFSESVDNSDEAAFAAAMRLARSGQPVDITQLRRTYDAALEQKYGVQFHAGKRVEDVAHGQIENAWDAIRQHADLLEHFFAQLEKLAADGTATHEQSEIAKKRLTYGVWAALKERIDKAARSTGGENGRSYGGLHAEIDQAYAVLAARGEQLLGCGGGISGEQALMLASPAQVFNGIFGNIQKEKLVWVEGYCRIDNCPTQPGKTKVAQCSVCKVCQAWYDRGRNPAKLYKGIVRAGKSAVNTSATGMQRFFVRKATKPDMK